MGALFRFMILSSKSNKSTKSLKELDQSARMSELTKKGSNDCAQGRVRGDDEHVTD